MPFRPNYHKDFLAILAEKGLPDTLTIEEALRSDDLAVVDAAAWAAPIAVLRAITNTYSEAWNDGQRGSLICYAADARGESGEWTHAVE